MKDLLINYIIERFNQTCYVKFDDLCKTNSIVFNDGSSSLNKNYEFFEIAITLNFKEIRFNCRLEYSSLTKKVLNPINCEVYINNLISKINIGFKDFEVTHLFGLLLFYNHNYIKIKTNLLDNNSEIKNKKNLKNFFQINKKLPMEIQMLICNLACDSKKELILIQDSDKVIKVFIDDVFWNCCFDKNQYFIFWNK
jgi:hypothetical protein